MKPIRAPSRGEIVHLDFSPQAGHEMRGPHYALVLSHQAYSVATGLAMVCPITSKIDKMSGFLVALPPGGRIRGAVVSSELRTVDFQARTLKIVGRAPDDLVETVVHNVRQVIG